jgi:DNA polymerase IV
MVENRSAWPKLIAHADMDAFYAAVEQLDNPSLRGKPVLVGPPSKRGVVLTASYEARPYHVGSAMPMSKAHRLCPDAVIVQPRFDRYKEVSRLIMAVFADFSPSVEAISLDEAFLDLSGSEELLGNPQVIGQKLKQRVREVTGGLTVSVGISATKYVAKVASAYQKPNGLTIVPAKEAQAWLAPLPVSRLWGVGPKTEKHLHALRLHTIGDVASADPNWLEEKIGRTGRKFYALAHAQDPRPVEGQRSAKSIGCERTLSEDVCDKNEIKRHLRLSAEEIGRRLKQKRRVAFGVRVKLKTNKFQVLTRQLRRQHPTDVVDQIFAEAGNILDAFDHPGPFRLVGLTAFDFASTDQKAQLDLFADAGRSRRLDLATDDIRQRFGPSVLQRANNLGQLSKTAGLNVTRDTEDSEET